MTPENGDNDALANAPVPLPSKTPLFQAYQAARYQRQALIKTIQAITQRCLICYVGGPQTSIHRDDVLGFVDLLHNVPAGKDLDLLVHTGGGDIDAAEKLISLVRTRAGAGGVLRVVVPDYAKSAGTLMALGADHIVMSDSSELGPIDPQVCFADSNGNRTWQSVHRYLDAFAKHSKELEVNPSNETARIMLGKMDPQTVELFNGISIRARKLAEGLLKQGMHKTNGKWSGAARHLLDTTQWQSHAQMISADAARHPDLDLNVEYQEPDSDLWRNYWQLYCYQRLEVGEDRKLFESDYVSLAVGQ